jgi:CDP-4-dehydro-6-deoxyglucose reductase, E1
VSGRAEQLRAQILELAGEFCAEAFAPRAFVPGETQVPVSGKVFDGAEMRSLVDSCLDFWLTTGRFAEQFEREFARWMGVRECVLVNSGSSANLVALSALTSPELADDRLVPGDEVLTLAAGFPTTVNPILQNNLVPVFLDITAPTYNADVTQLEAALGPRTRAIFFAHTLGNPFDIGAVTEFARKHDLWLIEDCCDAVGATYRGRKAGTFGDLATTSFYPAHHITMGEGGSVMTEKPLLRKLVESFRDWGRDCWCAPGKDNTCGKRFGWQLGRLPEGYDHKYIFSHLGYNLKATDLQAAVGLAQLRRMPAFVTRRRQNFAELLHTLEPFQDVLLLPRSDPRAEPCWYAFPITVRPEASFTKNEFVAFLEERRIATRSLFGGNLLRQPAWDGARYRIADSLTNSDTIMTSTFLIGVYPGIDDERLHYMQQTLRAFLTR